jgi:hypothetical protein
MNKRVTGQKEWTDQAAVAQHKCMIFWKTNFRELFLDGTPHLAGGAG